MLSTRSLRQYAVSKTPHIFFFDASKGETFDVTNTPKPIPVVVGQPIYLFAIPGGTPVQPKAWDIEGDPIGYYVGSSYLPPTSTPDAKPTPTPPPPCVQIINPASGCVSETTPPDYAHDFIKFYWTKPNLWTVKYNFGSGSATATFSALGPTKVDVVATPSQNAVIKNLPYNCPTKSGEAEFVVWGKEITGPEPGVPFEPGISFRAQATQPAKGEFEWQQLILGGYTVFSYLIGKSPVTVPALTGIDNYFFYPNFSTDKTIPDPDPIPNNLAFDAPSAPLTLTTTSVSKYLTGKMFLMWRPLEIPDSIPVTLGYVTWSTVFSADGLLNPSTFAHGNKGPFVQQTDYPTWTAVVHNCLP